MFLGIAAYTWWVLVHLIGVFGFLISHGVSIGVALRLRTEREPAKIDALLQLSSSSVGLMYLSLAVLLTGGVVAGFIGKWWSFGWIWASLGVLIFMVAVMAAMARPYYQRVGTIARAMAGGSEAVTPKQLDEVMRSGVSLVIAILGFASLAAILYFMVVKPF